MAEFYSEIQGNRGEATRMGTKNSGVRGELSTWTQIITVRQYSSDYTESGHQASINLGGKYGGSALYVAFDADTVYQQSDDPQVQEILSKIRDQFDALDLAAKAAATKSKVPA